MNKHRDRRVVVLGLDGVPFSLLMDYLGRGMMPELSRLTGTGSLVPITSSLPEVSSVAWSSFMTGKNPGEHGIFGFVEIDRSSYDYLFPDFTYLKKRPLWERHPIRAVVLNMPQTYPARPMNGVLVSGFVAPDIRKAVYPQRVLQYLEDTGYAIDVNARLAVENQEAFFEDLFATFAKRREAFEHLYDTEDWNLFIAVITETDRLHHFFFHSALGGEYFDRFESFYHEIDGFIGKMARKAEEDGAAFLTCSDHGFAPITTEVYLNRWLIEQGYLSVSGSSGLRGITADSRAFCLDPSRVYLHREGTYARGSVTVADAERLKDELTSAFLNITFQGRNVVQSVFRKEQIFRGAFTNPAPDLYVLPRAGFNLKGALDKDRVFGTSHFQGMHTYDDAHLFVSGKRDFGKLDIGAISGLIEAFLQG